MLRSAFVHRKWTLYIKNYCWGGEDPADVREQRSAWIKAKGLSSLGGGGINNVIEPPNVN